MKSFILDFEKEQHYWIPSFSPEEHQYVDIRESLPTPDFGLAEEYLSGPKADMRRLKLWDPDHARIPVNDTSLTF